MRGLQFGKRQLEGQRILGSGATKRRNLEKHDDRLRATIRGETDRVAGRGRQAEVWRHLTRLHGARGGVAEKQETTHVTQGE
jgi:hypothetical protein